MRIADRKTLSADSYYMVHFCFDLHFHTAIFDKSVPINFSTLLKMKKMLSSSFIILNFCQNFTCLELQLSLMTLIPHWHQKDFQLWGFSKPLHKVYPNSSMDVTTWKAPIVKDKVPSLVEFEILHQVFLVNTQNFKFFSYRRFSSYSKNYLSNI